MNTALIISIVTIENNNDPLHGAHPTVNAMKLKTEFFNRDACAVAQDLLGKVIRRNYKGHWLAARIIETEAYYLEDKGSHASLGYTEKRKALFMPVGTIYMYYARGHDSLNISVHGEGNAVLIKSAYFYQDQFCDPESLQIMQSLNPLPSGELRKLDKLCSGQTLLCRALHLKVTDWDQQKLSRQRLYIDDIDYLPKQVIQTTRLGIPRGRDEHLMQRYIDAAYTKHCTSNPLTKRNWLQDRHYRVHNITP